MNFINFSFKHNYYKAHSMFYVRHVRWLQWTDFFLRINNLISCDISFDYYVVVPFTSLKINRAYHQHRIELMQRAILDNFVSLVYNKIMIKRNPNYSLSLIFITIIEPILFIVHIDCGFALAQSGFQFTWRFPNTYINPTVLWIRTCCIDKTC